MGAWIASSAELHASEVAPIRLMFFWTQCNIPLCQLGNRVLELRDSRGFLFHGCQDLQHLCPTAK